MTTTTTRAVVVLGIPPPLPTPAPPADPERLAEALLADAIDNAESLAVDRVAALCAPRHAEAMAASTSIETVVWTSPHPTVREAAARAAEAGAGQVVVIAADAPHLPGLLVGKLFRPLGRAEVSISPDPRGGAAAIGLRLPAPRWVGEVDLDRRDVVDDLLGRAPRRALVRTAPGWRRLRESADFAALDSAVEGADLTRALFRD